MVSSDEEGILRRWLLVFLVVLLFLLVLVIIEVINYVFCIFDVIGFVVFWLSEIGIIWVLESKFMVGLKFIILLIEVG